MPCILGNLFAYFSKYETTFIKYKDIKYKKTLIISTFVESPR